jgi:hypothetical protein
MNNPFTSATFSAIWQKHFARGNSVTSVPLFSWLSFVKHPRLPLYTNIGSTHTKGISYELCPGEPEVYSNKVFRIFDVPTFFPLHTDTRNHPGLGLHRIRQYPGFLIDLSGYKDLNAYMQASFSKSSRYKLNKYKKRLETSFNIHYSMYYGEMDKDTYRHIFSRFRSLLEKRFDEKQVSNNNLDPEEWEFYYDVAYPMILEEKACLFVVYQGDTPIAITLNYLSDSILFDAITVFDIDYAKFHLGSVSIMGLIEWCIGNGIGSLDFSKGYFDYKKRWANREYGFEYHIYYDKGSLRSRILAFILKRFYEFKDYLRRKQLNILFHKIIYRLKKNRISEAAAPEFEFRKLETAYPGEALNKVDLSVPENAFLKPVVFEYLYLYTAHINDVSVQEVLGEPHTYLLSGPLESVIAKIMVQS